MIERQVSQSTTDGSGECDLIVAVAADNVAHRQGFLTHGRQVNRADETVEAARQEHDTIFMRPDRFARRRRLKAAADKAKAPAVSRQEFERGLNRPDLTIPEGRVSHRDR